MIGYERLILVTDRKQIPLPQYLAFIERCATTGVTAVQLREKKAPFSFLIEFGTRLQEMLTPLNIPLIINDNIMLAKALAAAGVHLGQTDGTPENARILLGKQSIIGLSIETLSELTLANQEKNISYVAASSVFPTRNKKNLKTIWELEGLKRLVTLSTHPVIAIGGINESNIIDVLSTGVSGIAVIGAIHDAVNPQEATRNLRTLIDQHCHPENHYA